jgi:AcrR family transcriptional regulator
MARQKSAKAHGKVLEAALDLFADRGIDATSMDAIAGASGVSKATIYKHWPDKDALCLEVLSHLHGLDEEPPVFNSGDLRADLIAQLGYQPAEERKKMMERIMPHLMAYGASHRAFGEQWRGRAIERPLALLKQILRRGKTRSLLRRDLDLDAAAALLMGPMMYRHIFGNSLKTKLPPGFVEYVVDAFWTAHAGEPPQSTASNQHRRPR